MAPFRYEELRVGPGVFIPRPETEQLVELALQVLAKRPAGQRRVVELCAGSGAITLCLAHEIGGVELHAVELSDAAWPYLLDNLRGLEVDLVHGDMAEAFRPLDGTVDQNKPDIAAAKAREWFDQDGMDALRVVRDVACRLLRPGGHVLAEHDEKQSLAVTQLFGGPDFELTRDLADLTGRPRYVSAQRAPVKDRAPAWQD